MKRLVRTASTEGYQQTIITLYPLRYHVEYHLLLAARILLDRLPTLNLQKPFSTLKNYSLISMMFTSYSLLKLPLLWIYLSYRFIHASLPQKLFQSIPETSHHPILSISNIPSLQSKTTLPFYQGLSTDNISLQQIKICEFILIYHTVV